MPPLDCYWNTLKERDSQWTPTSTSHNPPELEYCALVCHFHWWKTKSKQLKYIRHKHFSTSVQCLQQQKCYHQLTAEVTFSANSFPKQLLSLHTFWICKISCNFHLYRMLVLLHELCCKPLSTKHVMPVSYRLPAVQWVSSSVALFIGLCVYLHFVALKSYFQHLSVSFAWAMSVF